MITVRNTPVGFLTFICKEGTIQADVFARSFGVACKPQDVSQSVTQVVLNIRRRKRYDKSDYAWL